MWWRLFTCFLHISNLRGEVWMFYTLLKLSEKKIIFSFTINLCIRTPACVRQHKKERSVCFFLCVYFCGVYFSVFFVFVFEWNRFFFSRKGRQRSALYWWMSDRNKQKINVWKGEIKRDVLSVSNYLHVCVCVDVTDLLCFYLNLKFTLALAFSSSDLFRLAFFII